MGSGSIGFSYVKRVNEVRNRVRLRFVPDVRLTKRCLVLVHLSCI